MNVHTMGFHSQTHNLIREEIVCPRILMSLISRLSMLWFVCSLDLLTRKIFQEAANSLE